MKTTDKTETVKVDIGGIAITYHLIETDAPIDYDGFGTFTVMEYKGENDRPARTVLVDDRHLGWQLARYNSGNHYTKPSALPTSAFIDFLWNRVQGRTQ